MVSQVQSQEDIGEAQERNEAYYTHNSWSQEARHVCYIGSSGKHKGDPEVLEGRTQGNFRSWYLLGFLRERRNRLE